MSLFARGISSRLTNAFPFGSAVASRESRYCRVVWSMSLPFYVVVYGPNHIFHCLSNILARDCAVVRNAPLWLSIRDINFSTPSRQTSWVLFAVVCFVSLFSLSLMADVAESLNQAGTRSLVNDVSDCLRSGLPPASITSAATSRACVHRFRARGRIVVADDSPNYGFELGRLRSSIDLSRCAPWSTASALVNR